METKVKKTFLQWCKECEKQEPDVISTQEDFTYWRIREEQKLLRSMIV